MKWHPASVRKSKWHKWYAWYPVQLSFELPETMVWLEYVERKIIIDWYEAAALYRRIKDE